MTFVAGIVAVLALGLYWSRPRPDPEPFLQGFEWPEQPPWPVAEYRVPVEFCDETIVTPRGVELPVTWGWGYRELRELLDDIDRAEELGA